MKQIGVKSDVWSLGCILYNMVYSLTPFHKFPNQFKLQVLLNPHHTIDFPDIPDKDLLDVLKVRSTTALICTAKGRTNFVLSLHYCFLGEDMMSE